MFEAMEGIVRLANGLVTVGLSPFLFKIFGRTGRRFYLLWGLGFFLYGINISLRAIFNLTNWAEPNSAMWFVFLFYMSGFIFMITGIGDLIDKAKVVLASVLALPLIPFIVYVVSGPALIGWSVTLSPFLLISVSLVFIRRKYAASVDLFILGWLLLLLTNFAWPMNMMNPIYLELFAIFGKIVIFVGMINPRFSLLANDLKRYLISGIPEAYTDEKLERFTLLYPKSHQRTREIKSIREMVTENSIKGIKTILITLYDLISPLELKSIGLTEDNLYLVRMIPAGESSIQAFQDSIMTMKDDLTQLEIFLRDIINISNEKKIRCDVILYTLSWIIHTHGWKRVYSLLISKMPDLKASLVHLYCFYYPETHEDKAEISKFEKLADKITII